MKAGYFIVKGTECYATICTMLNGKLDKHFKTEIIDGVIYFTEDFSHLNNSELMTVIRVQQVNSDVNECEIEIVSGGGAIGIFSQSFGNETRRVNKALKLITEFCLAKDFIYSKIAYKN
jgi:hypothetical protein